MPRYFIRFCIEHVSNSSTKKYYSRTVNIIKCMNFITLSIIFKFILINRFDRKSLKIKFITGINDITSFFFNILFYVWYWHYWTCPSVARWNYCRNACNLPSCSFFLWIVRWSRFFSIKNILYDDHFSTCSSCFYRFVLSPSRRCTRNVCFAW
jgi:hypothetical protein